MTDVVRGEEERYAALRGLRGVGDESADAARLEALGDASFRVRGEAVFQLAARPVSAQIEGALVDGLGAGDNAGLRNAACDLMVRYGGGIAGGVARAMRADDADVRKLAIDVAGEIGDASLAGALLAALRDANVNVRIAAAEALGSFDSKDAAAALLRGLDDGELVFELACLESLARLKCAVSVERLERHLRDPYKRRAALALLGFSPGEESLGTLLGALCDERASALVAAVKALGVWMDASDRTDGGQRDDVTRRVRAAIPLDREDKVLARIEALLNDERVAGAAACLLGRLGFPRAAVALALATKEIPALTTAFDAALRVLDSRAADRLERALGQAESEDWVWLVRALDVLGDIRGASALIARTEGGQEPDRHLIDALGRVTDRRAIPILLRCARSADSEVSDLAVRSLRAAAERQPAVLAEALAELPGDEYRDVRGVEIEGALGSLASQERMLRVLGSGPDDVRAAAVRALAEIQSGAAFSRLLELAVSGALSVRVAAVVAVGSYSAEAIGDSNADTRRAALVRLLDDEESQIREAAAAALSCDTSAAAVCALAEGLTDGEASVAMAAVRALSTIAARGQEAAWSAILAFAVDETGRGAERFSNPLAIEVWKETLSALAHPPVPAAFEILADALGSLRWDIRSAAARALGARRDRNAFTPLRAALQRESDLVVRRALEDALVALARETRGI
jgi:HEAT repeat protein